MIPDLLVYGVLALTGVFVVAWAVSPQLRARIEAPKHLFVEDIQRYDRKHHD
jgi:hypothetical protein